MFIDSYQMYYYYFINEHMRRFPTFYKTSGCEGFVCYKYYHILFYLIKINTFYIQYFLNIFKFRKTKS